MKLSTNAGSVARRIQVYADGLPGAVKAAIEPDDIHAMLKTTALNFLLSAAMGETFNKAAKGNGSTERHDRLTALAKSMAAGMTWGLLEGGAGQWHMIEARSKLESQREERPAGSSFAQKVEWAQYGSGNWRSAEEVRQLTIQWVKEKKDPHPEDFERMFEAKNAGKSFEEVTAEHLLMVMGVRAPKFDGHAGELKEAGDKLKRAIGEWLEGSAEGSAVAGDAALVSQWLAGVAETWREVLRQRIPLRLAVQLEKLHWRVRNELGV